MWQNLLGIISEHLIYRTLQGTLFPLTLVQSCQSYHVIFKWPWAQISQTFSSVLCNTTEEIQTTCSYIFFNDWNDQSPWKQQLKYWLHSLTHTHSVCIIYIKFCSTEMQKFLLICVVLNIYKSELRGNNSIKVVRKNNKK